MIYGLLPAVFNKLRGIFIFLSIIMIFYLGVENSIVLCISPLTAIMMEQSERFSSIGITSEFVGEAQLDPSVRQRVLRGLVPLVFISPEKIICNTQYRNMLLTPNYKRHLIAVTVDEAHCIKMW